MVIIIENSGVVGNTAMTSAGGIYVQSVGNLRVNNTTVENNTAGKTGGESATFSALLTIIYLFGTTHGEQVLGSLHDLACGVTDSAGGIDEMVQVVIIVGASSAGSCTDVMLWFCYVQAGFSDSFEWGSSSRTRVS